MNEKFYIKKGLSKIESYSTVANINELDEMSSISMMEDYTMHIREAMPEDNDELQELQAKCLMGTTLIVSTVNTPDFFARARAYESHKVFVACEDNRIIGSAACAIRDPVVNGNIHRVGYEFQYFTSLDYRRKGVARRLHQHIEDYLTRQGVLLSYCLIMEGNLSSIVRNFYTLQISLIFYQHG